MNRFIKIVVFNFLLLAPIILINCGGKNDKNPSDEKETTNIVELKDACDILSQADVEKIMDVKIENFKNTLSNSNSDKTRWASQCSYYLKEGNKSISILIQYNANETNPTNLDGLISSMSVPGDEESSKELSEALKKGTVINNLGEIAVWYAIYEEAPTLLVRYKDHYQIIINTLFFDYNDGTMNKAKALAEKVIEKM